MTRGYDRGFAAIIILAATASASCTATTRNNAPMHGLFSMLDMAPGGADNETTGNVILLETSVNTASMNTNTNTSACNNNIEKEEISESESIELESVSTNATTSPVADTNAAIHYHTDTESNSSTIEAIANKTKDRYSSFSEYYHLDGIERTRNNKITYPKVVKRRCKNKSRSILLHLQTK